MVKNPVQFVKTATAFNPSTFDVVWPLNNDVWLEFLYLRLAITIDDTISTRRIYNIQFNDSNGNVMYDSTTTINLEGGGVPPTITTVATIVANQLFSESSALQNIIVPLLLPPNTTMRIYDTNNSTVATDNATLYSAMFNT